MGDMSEMRGLVVVGSFLGMLVLLIGWMPPQFYTSAETKRTIDYPDYFESSGIMNYNSTYWHNLTYPDYANPWGKTEFGHDMVFYAYEWFGDNLRIRNAHKIPFIPWFWEPTHDMEWIKRDSLVNRGTILTASEIDTDSVNGVSSYKVQCEHFYMYGSIIYNASAYDDSYEAFQNDGLYAIFGIDWDQKGTSMNSWSLISSILFFQAPSVDMYTTAMIAIPVWCSVAYLAFIFVLRAIGAVFGGGA